MVRPGMSSFGPPLGSEPIRGGPGMAGMTSAWAALQEAAEKVAVGVLAGQCECILSQARAAAWLPDTPARAGTGASPYTTELLALLKVLKWTASCACIIFARQ